MVVLQDQLQGLELDKKKCCNGHVFLLLSLLANRFLTDDYKIVVENKFLSKIFRTDRYIYGLYF